MLMLFPVFSVFHKEALFILKLKSKVELMAKAVHSLWRVSEENQNKIHAYIFVCIS